MRKHRNLPQEGMIVRNGFRPVPFKQATDPLLKVKEAEPEEKKPFSFATFLLKWKTIPKALALTVKYKTMNALLKWRNKAPKILIHPDSRLKRIAEPVDFEKTTVEDRAKIVRKMAAALGGTDYGMRLGLAAPQIGINLRVIIVRGNVMFNPTWTPTNAPKERITEGCYSVPHKEYIVERAPYGWAKWTSIDGRPCEDKIKGLPAIVFQHELDHLDGKCCVDVGELLEPSRTPDTK